MVKVVRSLRIQPDKEELPPRERIRQAPGDALCDTVQRQVGRDLIWPDDRQRSGSTRRLMFENKAQHEHFNWKGACHVTTECREQSSTECLAPMQRVSKDF